MSKYKGRQNRNRTKKQQKSGWMKKEKQKATGKWV